MPIRFMSSKQFAVQENRPLNETGLRSRFYSPRTTDFFDNIVSGFGTAYSQYNFDIGGLKKFFG